MQEATINAEQQADLWLIGGHGCYQNIRFGEGAGEEKLLDLNDRNQLKGVCGAVAAGGTIVLDSCSTGRGKYGGPEITNMAEFIHQDMPDVTLYAPTHPVSGVVKVDENGMFVDPGYEFNEKNHPDGETFVMQPKPVEAEQVVLNPTEPVVPQEQRPQQQMPQLDPIEPVNP